ncbi:ABC transporter ATP-binding protein [Staphylococcus pragensis]|uniref:ABC transporter ATP-binding protein n=1 Tax=Staphylococcus pragensis TaxID=1611836 RepID=A0A4Z1B0G9_9STAP|nr:ABC transporter ATP-binding protein [Staphylococcus pragensis]RTX89093.1 ABC transporter ATP-binding protein [Staphylococcus carnosus]TGN26553.1 ABC transporter ATP-binding protein [Staphylococcus pragensis]GGG95018.1 ABC transporter ATP-binding protein [Staphylococcus pragensis]
MNAIELRNVNYSNKSFALRDISFDVPQGFVTGFIGGNGAGKTTVIRLIMDLLEANSGEIKVLDKKMMHEPQWIKNKIGFVYSEIYFNQQWSVKKLESFISPFYTDWDTEVFHDYLARFNLPYKGKIKHFSTGMKMKLSLAIALSHHAELFIFDEPTAGLDPIVRNEVLEILQQELIDENKTVFISTHIISDLEKIADYLVYLKDGQVKIQGYRNELQEHYFIVRGDTEDLDEELNQLFLYKEEKSTGYLGFTQQAHVFKELFGNKVDIKQPSIEELMIYLEKSDRMHLHQEQHQSELIQ